MAPTAAHARITRPTTRMLQPCAIQPLFPGAIGCFGASVQDRLRSNRGVLHRAELAMSVRDAEVGNLRGEQLAVARCADKDTGGTGTGGSVRFRSGTPPASTTSSARCPRRRRSPQPTCSPRARIPPGRTSSRSSTSTRHRPPHRPITSPFGPSTDLTPGHCRPAR
jgi:hypothetical protein